MSFQLKTNVAQKYLEAFNEKIEGKTIEEERILAKKVVDEAIAGVQYVISEDKRAVIGFEDGDIDPEVNFGGDHEQILFAYFLSRGAFSDKRAFLRIEEGKFAYYPLLHKEGNRSKAQIYFAQAISETLKKTKQNNIIDFLKSCGCTQIDYKYCFAKGYTIPTTAEKREKIRLDLKTILESMVECRGKKVFKLIRPLNTIAENP